MCEFSLLDVRLPPEQDFHQPLDGIQKKSLLNVRLPPEQDCHQPLGPMRLISVSYSGGNLRRRSNDWGLLLKGGSYVQ